MYSIGRHRILDAARLEHGRYFESLLQEATRAGLLAYEEAERIQADLLLLLAAQCDSYHLGESSSIRVEQADAILHSICFALSQACRAQPGPEEAVDYLRRTPLPEAYALGKKRLRGKLHYATHLYKRARSTRTQANIYAYHDTLRQEGGIGGFFRQYDIQYAAHEIPGTIDYPLCIPPEGCAGVEYIIEYLRRLVLENQFCAHFAPDATHRLLLGYSSGYPKLLLNLFRQVLAGALCCALCGRPVRELFFTKMEAARIQAACLRHPEGIAPALEQAAAAVRQALAIPPGDLAAYMEQSLRSLTEEGIAISKTGAPNPLFSPPAPPVIQP